MTKEDFITKLNDLHEFYGSWEIISRELKVSQGTVIRWKNGTTSPSFESMDLMDKLILLTASKESAYQPKDE